MSVVVTGATGFIGNRLVRQLLDDGADVRAFCLPGEPTTGLEGAEIVRGDVTDRASVHEALAGAERVYHLAAIVGDWGDEARYRAVNVEGTRNVLDAAAAAGAARVLMVSSIVVYGWQLHTTQCDEGLPREYGVSPYSRTKRESEELALAYDALGRVPVTVVRPGNVYGPRSTVWVDWVLDLLRAGRVLLVDGGRGDAALAYVDNVVEVIVRAAASPDAAGRIYNAADGGGVTWSDYLGDLAGIADLEPPRRSVDHRVAWTAAIAMERVWRALGREEPPLLTREVVTLLSSREPVPIRRAADELHYVPIAYDEALERVADYVNAP